MARITVRAAGETTTVDYSLAPAAYPDASNTGAKGTLTVYTGDRTISGNNVVIENQDIRGRIDFLGTGCILRNCKLTYTGYWPLRFMAESGTPGLVEDCTLIAGVGSQCSVYGDNVTIRRCNIYGGPDGIKAGNNVVITDNYVHDLANDPAAHHDGIDVEGNGPATVKHNTVLVSYGETSCITVTRWTGGTPFNNVLVEDNLLAGAGYCIYGPGSGAPTPTNVRIINNKFSKRYYPRYGSYGWIAYEPPSGNGNLISGNRDYETGALL